MSQFHEYDWGAFAQHFWQQQQSANASNAAFRQQAQAHSTYQFQRVERDEAGLICRIARDKGVRLKEERILGFVRFVWRLPNGQTIEGPLKETRDSALLCACQQVV